MVLPCGIIQIITHTINFFVYIDHEQEGTCMFCHPLEPCKVLMYDNRKLIRAVGIYCYAIYKDNSVMFYKMAAMHHLISAITVHGKLFQGPLLQG